ncbi:uncharacterized protein SAMN04487760_10923 [Lachnospiraceae bacterium G41]|nr:uncharacterized protein SAMN04487760_10923 [Lachnospiraceae bacterium G41]
MKLEEFFKEYPKVAIAFSGGCDSAYLTYAALKYAREVKAYYVKTAFQPEFELEDALKFAKEYALDLSVIECDILSVQDVANNPSNRCYFCKNQIFGKILGKANEDGYTTILDGTNASDDASDRPGMKALEEMKVISPLRLCNLSKRDIRELSKAAGLFTWDKPAYACLATRVPEGTQITKEILEKTEKAEAYLASLGLTNFRVRYRDGDALIQIAEGQQDLYEQNKDKIEAELGQYYVNLKLDEKLRDKI